MLIGFFSEKSIKAIGLSIEIGTPIYLGETNINHMINSHPLDYTKYEAYLPEIIRSPDYIGADESDGTIEFVKYIQTGNEHIKVAVRIANSGKYYVRTLYTITQRRIEQFITKGYLVKLDKDR
jgi:hypothetical protein